MMATTTSTAAWAYPQAVSLLREMHAAAEAAVRAINAAGRKATPDEAEQMAAALGDIEATTEKVEKAIESAWPDG